LLRINLWRRIGVDWEAIGQLTEFIGIIEICLNNGGLAESIVDVDVLVDL
jgi:hypothetical protein